MKNVFYGFPKSLKGVGRDTKSNPGSSSSQKFQNLMFYENSFLVRHAVKGVSNAPWKVLSPKYEVCICHMKENPNFTKILKIEILDYGEKVYERRGSKLFFVAKS